MQSNFGKNREIVLEGLKRAKQEASTSMNDMKSDKMM